MLPIERHDNTTMMSPGPFFGSEEAECSVHTIILNNNQMAS